MSAISKSQVLSQFEHLQHQTIMDMMYPVCYKQNDIILRKGEIAACLLVIESGEIVIEVNINLTEKA